MRIQIRNNKYRYDLNKTRTLEQTRLKNAKAYWNMLKDASGVPKLPITLDNFAAYFKAVNNPNDPFFRPDEDVIYFNERYVNNELHIMFSELDSVITNEEIHIAI